MKNYNKVGKFISTFFIIFFILIIMLIFILFLFALIIEICKSLGTLTGLYVAAGIVIFLIGFVLFLSYLETK
jgi:hypothetical protein